jgi:uncharacterized protein (TIGR02145 family)
MKKILFFVVLLFSFDQLFSQTSNYIIVNKNDGSAQWHKLSQIDSITFTTMIDASACPGISTVQFAGKTYNTVQIGSQCWLKENLDVGTMIQTDQNASNNGVIEKYCYNNAPANCNTYGGLYQWNETMQYVTTQGTQGICPDGWHIPTLVELHILEASAGYNSNALKTVGQGTGSGAGTNTTGFSALLAGNRRTNSSFSNLGVYTYFWSSTQDSTGFAFTTYMNFRTSINYTTLYDWRGGFSVRCLKD